MRVGLGLGPLPTDAPGAGSVVLALVDALLGAAGLGDVEGRRPELPEVPDPADPESALELLRETVRLVEAENYQVVNADGCLDGRLEPGLPLPTLRERIAERLHVAPDRVSLKLVSGEGSSLGTGSGGLGRVLFVVLLDRIEDTDALLASIRSGG